MKRADNWITLHGKDFQEIETKRITRTDDYPHFYEMRRSLIAVVLPKLRYNAHFSRARASTLFRESARGLYRVILEGIAFQFRMRERRVT